MIAKRVKAWIEVQYPKIRARALPKGAGLFGDEMGVRPGQAAGRTHSLRGQRTVVKLTGMGGLRERDQRRWR